jgi:hypothetical protein
MRDFGFNYFWSDPYCKNLHAVGFERTGIAGEYLAISAFEVLEHVEDSVPILKVRSNRVAVEISSLVLSSSGGAPPTDWWYYSFPTGQHISFYSAVSLCSIPIDSYI